MLGHPGVPGVLVSLLLRTKGDETWQGVWRAGAEPSRCRACPERGRTFLLEYTYAGQSPDVKQRIVEMAMNASGIRDTARV